MPLTPAQRRELARLQALDDKDKDRQRRRRRSDEDEIDDEDDSPRRRRSSRNQSGIYAFVGDKADELFDQLFGEDEDEDDDDEGDEDDDDEGDDDEGEPDPPAATRKNRFFG